MSTLTELATQVAAHIAHNRGWSLEQATRWVESLLTEAQPSTARPARR
jgi:hypothetical protein